MAKQATWKTAQARAELQLIAADLAEFFSIPAPPVFQPDYRTGRDWEWRIDTVEVWTKAGRAECAIDVSARFAHMYFRFDDLERAAVFNCGGRLNPFSGKWNALATPDSWARLGNPCPQTSLEMFRAELRRDFRKVAEPNPPAAEVEAYRVKAAAVAAAWEINLETLES